MLRHRARQSTIGGLALCFLAFCAPALAADLTRPPRPAAPPDDYGQFVPQHHGCRLIPQPLLNLWGEVTTYTPTMVCVSRGLYADTFPPPPPPRPHPFFDLW